MADRVRKYGVAAILDGIPLLTTGSEDYKASPTLAAGDVKISKDGGAFANITDLPSVTPAAGRAVRITLTSTEMQAARILVQFVDQTSPKEWADQFVIVETFGHASAQEALDRSINQTGDSFARLGAPAGVSVSADLLAIDDYLDTEVAAIKAKTDNLPANPAAVGSAMALTSAERDSIAAALLDLADGVETGKTLRQTQRAIAAILVGLVSGAGSGTEVFKAIGAASGGTTRVTVTVDRDGNRDPVTLNL